MLNIVSEFFKFLKSNRGHLKHLDIQSRNGVFSLTRTDIEHSPTPTEKIVPKASVESLESDIDEFWRTVPFHTLFLIYELRIQNSGFGGTCTDRTMLFHQKLQKKYGPSLNIKLHRASMNDRETHTVLIVQLNQKAYLIDVGANWPVMRMVPCFKDSSFETFGISFRSFVNGGLLDLQMRKSGEDDFKKFLKLDLTHQSEAYVTEQISNRFSRENKLPFSNSLRYAFVHEDRFYVIKHDEIVGMDHQGFVSSYTAAKK